MLLNEFFGRTVKSDKNKDQKSYKSDDLFWFILDHDKLHKDHFFPVANKIKSGMKKNKIKRDECIMELKPMVEKGCLEYYHAHKLSGKPSKLFSKELRDDMCNRLYDHYHEHIKKGDYKLD